MDGTSRIFELDKDNSEVLQTTDIRVPNTMFVEAHGDGCALLQVRKNPKAAGTPGATGAIAPAALFSIGASRDRGKAGSISALLCETIQ